MSSPRRHHGAAPPKVVADTFDGIVELEQRVAVMVGWKTSRLLGKSALDQIESEREKVAHQCCHAVTWASMQLVVALFFFILFGCIFYCINEDWTILESIFFCTVTISTVGYGGKGLEPDNMSSRVFTIFYIFFGIVLVFTRLTYLLSLVQEMTHQKVELLLEKQREKRRREGLKCNQMSEGEYLGGFWAYYGYNFGVYMALLLILVLVSAGVFCWTESASDHPVDHEQLMYIDAIYFSWITLTTLGYSDTSITTKASMIWCTCFIYIGAGFFAVLASHFSSLAHRREQQVRHNRAFVQKLDLEFVNALQQTAKDTVLQMALKRGEGLGSGGSAGANPFASADQEHDRLSFLVTMLVHLELASRADVLRILDYFEEMDLDRSGSVSFAEIEKETQRISEHSNSRSRKDATMSVRSESDSK